MILFDSHGCLRDSRACARASAALGGPGGLLEGDDRDKPGDVVSRRADNLKALAFCPVQTRLANLLLDYAAFFAADESLGLRIVLPLSQEDMAKDLAVTRKALTIAMAVFQDLELVGKEKGRYVIKDVEKLRQFASHTLSLSYSSDGTLHEH